LKIKYKKGEKMIVTTKDLFKVAYGKFAIGAYNINNLEQCMGLFQGVCKVSNDGYLINVIERTKIFKENNFIKFIAENGKQYFLTGDEIVSMNMWGFKPSIFTFLEGKFNLFLKGNIDNLKSEFFIPSVVDELIKESLIKVKVLHSEDQWFGITYKEDRELVERQIRDLIERGVYPEKLSSFVS